MDTLTSNVEDVQWIDVDHESACGRVRRAATDVARRLGFDEHRCGEVAIATSELATNVFRHATNGRSLLRVRRQGERAGVEVLFVDRGPGIADLQAMSRDGNSTRGTLGVGIGAAMRMASLYDCYSLPGHGTVTVATFWDADTKPSAPAVNGLTRSMSGELRCGDAWAYAADDGVTKIILADGLGHGELAAVASSKAIAAFRQTASTSAADVMEQVNKALRSTRGAAAAVMVVNEATSSATFCGIGNVSVWLEDGEGRKGLASGPGIAGAYAKTIRELSVELTPHTTVVMHSDGLTSKWSLARYPALRRRDPLLVAATLLRDAGVHHDDASVVVMRTS